MVLLNPDPKVKSNVIDRATVFDQYLGTEKWGLSFAKGLPPGYSRLSLNEHLCETDTQSWSLPFFTPFI